MNLRDIIQHWSARVLADPGPAKNANAIYKLVLTGESGGTWVVRCKEPLSISEVDGEAECTVTMDGDTFLGIIDGSVNPQSAFLMGKMAIGGNMLLALKLAELMRHYLPSRID